MAQHPFDTSRYRWREVTDPGAPYKIRHDYTILGHDVGAGTLDQPGSDLVAPAARAGAAEDNADAKRHCFHFLLMS